jgi:hypothetical protein
MIISKRKRRRVEKKTLLPRLKQLHHLLLQKPEICR